MQIFAHRGVSAHYPENTLAAFQAALDAGCDGIEFDVIHCEQHALVFHDRTLDRCTNGSGAVDAHSLAQLRTLNAGNGERIPLLNEVLQLIQNQCLLNIEIKHPNVLAATIEAIALAESRFGLSREQVIISSFHHSVLAAFHQHCPGTELAALIAHAPHCFDDIFQLPIQALHCDLDSITPELADAVVTRGLALRVYTVDQAADIRWLQQLGAHGIFSNDPQQARSVLLPTQPNRITTHGKQLQAHAAQTPQSFS